MSVINIGGIDVPLQAFDEAFGQSPVGVQGQVAPTGATIPGPSTTATPVNPKASSATSVSAEVSGDHGILETIGDMAKGVVGGVRDAAQETIDLGYDVANWADDKVGVNVLPDQNPMVLPEVSENVTSFGRLTRNVSQFAAGFVGAGKVLNAAKVLQGTSKAAALARGMAQGAITDFAAFDPHEDRLSNLIEEHPELSNPVTRYLAADKGDSNAEGRFKNALEGLGLGAAVEGIFHGVKAIKALRTAKSGKEAESILSEAADALAGTVKDTDDAIAKTAADETVAIRSKTPHGDALVDTGGVRADGVEAAKEAPDATGRRYNDVMDAADFKDVLEKAKTIDEVVEHGADSINLRRSVFESAEPTNVMRVLSDKLYDRTLKGAGVESHAEIMSGSTEYLEKAGFKLDNVIADVQKDSSVLEEMSRRLYAARATLGMMVKESVRLGSLLDSGRATIKDMASFYAMHRDVQDLHIAVADVRTGSGRLLSSQKMTVNTTKDLSHADLFTAGKTVEEGVEAGTRAATESVPRKRVTLADIEKMTEEEATQFLTSNGVDSQQLKKLARYVRMADGDPFAVSRMMNQAFTGSWWGVHHEYWMNSILSGYRTMGANLLGNTLKGFMMPGEKVLGGLMTGDRTLVREGINTYMGMTKFLTDSCQIAWKAFKADANIIDAASSVVDGASHQITYDNLKNLMLSKRLGTTSMEKLSEASLTPWEEMVARSMGWMGQYLRLPSRILMSTDELFKQLNFRADLYSRLHTVALDKLGTNASPEAISAFVEREMSKFFDNGGRAVDFKDRLAQLNAQFGGAIPTNVQKELEAYGTLSDASLRYAQTATWTQPLQYGIGNSLSRLAMEHPSLRMVVPFIRTPTNILRDFMAHTPGVAQLTRRYREAIIQGGEAEAMAKGQLATGSMLWATAITLAQTGTITGAPPTDTKLRERLMATGWEPWSIKVGDKYVSYRRVDPVGMFLGMAADYTRLWQDRGSLENEDVAMGMVVALANNLTSKTYLQGITEVIGAITNPDENMLSFLKKRGASYIPMSSFLRNIRQDMSDPHMREVRSMLDYVMNTVPGWSDTLPAKRDWVTGRPTDYTIVGSDSNDLVMSELNRLSDKILGAPPKRIRGSDELTAQQYSRLCELHGAIKLGGKTLHQTLETLFKSPGYDIERNQFDDPPIGMNGPRVDKVNKIIETYRKAAQNQLLREDRSLLMNVEQARRTVKLAKRGALTTANQEQMNKLLGF